MFQASNTTTQEYMQAPMQYSRIRMEEILQKLPEQDATEALTDNLGWYKCFFNPVSIVVVIGSSISGQVFDLFRGEIVKIIWQDL